MVVCAIVSGVAAFAGPTALAQSVSYEISFPNLVHHEAEVSAVFSGLEPGEALELRMSRTSPGRYALHEFARNVYNVRIEDGAGRRLAFSRPDLHQWTVDGHGGTVRVSYTLFADRADGTYSGINNRYAHLNIPATFMWARGFQDAPVTLRVNPPRAGWDIATQLFPTEDRWQFAAPDFWYFVDSPVHIGRLQWETWTLGENGKTYMIRLALHHDGTEAQGRAFAELVREVTLEEIAMWRDIPDFDTGTYTFIAAYLPSVNGDGMEHRNSTVLTYPRGLTEGPLVPSDAWLDPIGTVSHEFFHAWNVERLRPRSLEPFNFEAANVSGELWFAEGFTSYYDGLFLRRAGLVTDAEYASSLTGPVETATNAPGRHYFSPIEMSMQAPFVDAASWLDPDNRRNTFVSYYTGGDALALGLDLEMRGRFNVTLDDYMRAMWDRFGKDETPYTLDDLERVLAEVTGDAGFATWFFETCVRGNEVMDYERLLAQAGFAVIKARPSTPWLGADLADAETGGAMLVEEPLLGSPLYEAGLERGNTIVALGAGPVENAAYLRGATAQRSVGDTLAITAIQNGEVVKANVVLAQDPAVAVIPFETIGRSVSKAQREFRDRWLRSSRLASE